MNDPGMDDGFSGGIAQWFASLFRTLWRSGMVTALVIGLLVIGLSVAYRERGRGHLHLLEQKIVTDHQDAPVLRPGGQEAIVLTRSRIAGGSVPEFLSATIFPGRGMNVLQITAYVPGEGEVQLMASPSSQEAERAMTGVDADLNGRASLAMGGAFEAPWAGGVWAMPGQPREHVTAVWRGHTMTLPTTGTDDAVPVAWGGRMLAASIGGATTAGMPDGGQTSVTYDAGDFGGHWPSATQMTISVLLSNRWIELTMTAKNTGDTAEPMGMGWHPRFAIDATRREQMKLRVGGMMRTEVRDQRSGLPTGALIPVAGTPYDFSQPGGARLGTLELNDTFVHLHQDLLDNGPIAELIDPQAKYGLRMTALSPTIKAMHVIAPLDGGFISIDPAFNYDDPFGKEWKDTDTGMVVLQPGQTTQWKVRLELFSPPGSVSPI